MGGLDTHNQPASASGNQVDNSNSYVVERKLFYMERGEVVHVVAREKTPDGGAYMQTISRGINNIQFYIPYILLNDNRYFRSYRELVGVDEPVTDLRLDDVQSQDNGTITSPKSAERKA